MFKQRKHYNKTPMRRRIPGVGAETFRGSRTPIRAAAAATAMANVIKVTFDQPVIWNGDLPKWSNGSSVPLNVVQQSATTFEITFSPTTAEADIIVASFEDPAFRNVAGGYMFAFEPVAVEAAP